MKEGKNKEGDNGRYGEKRKEADGKGVRKSRKEGKKKERER